MKKAIYKVPNGKLLKISLEDHDGKIDSIKITGDFFMYPEEHIEKLEASLKGCELLVPALEARLKDFLEKTPTSFFGLDNASLVSTILSAA
ncbi:MAG: lipoate protein ligase C-terminal domain-containing protein [Patescibacteria group bacterium]